MRNGSSVLDFRSHEQSLSRSTDLDEPGLGEPGGGRTAHRMMPVHEKDASGVRVPGGSDRLGRRGRFGSRPRPRRGRRVREDLRPERRREGEVVHQRPLLHPRRGRHLASFRHHARRALGCSRRGRVRARDVAGPSRAPVEEAAVRPDGRAGGALEGGAPLGPARGRARRHLLHVLLRRRRGPHEVQDPPRDLEGFEDLDAAPGQPDGRRRVRRPRSVRDARSATSGSCTTPRRARPTAGTTS